jgi:chromate transporter
MIAFIEEQLVTQLHWISHQDLLGGLALGQLTPGPIVVVAAYVGYKVAGIAGAAVAATAIFAPSFILTLSVLPIFERVRGLAWVRAAMEGVGPAVIGSLAVSLLRLTPHALSDSFAAVLFVASLVALLSHPINRRIGTMKLMLAGGLLGMLRNRLTPLAGLRMPLA